MRIVAIADTHMFHQDLNPLPRGDVLVHAGDLARFGSFEELIEVVGWLRLLPFEHKIIISGNHDRFFEESRAKAIEILGPAIIYLEDSLCEIEGVTFWGSPWQPAFNHWAFNLPRGEALASKWSLIPSNIDVLITHGPPMGIGDHGDDPIRAGCEDLKIATNRVKPKLHLFGHIHHDGGCWFRDEICFANVTTWECERRPTVIDFDPVTKAVTLIDVPPASMSCMGESLS